MTMGAWRFVAAATVGLAACAALRAEALPDPAHVRPVKLFELEHFSEGVCFDQAGYGYVSSGDTIWKFTLDGHVQSWAKTGAPNGHKVLADGTHLVCDASHHAVLHLAADGQSLAPAATEFAGQALRDPNDLTLDLEHGGFYFTDPRGSSAAKPVGSVYHVDAQGKVQRIAEGLAFPNGIARTADGKRLLVAESERNRILAYEIIAPGRVGHMQVFADLPNKNSEQGQIDNQPDGICLDAEGNLYVAHFGMRQIQVIDPQGKFATNYPAGNLTASNVAFGGPDLDQLFVTGSIEAYPTRGAVFRLDLGVKGQRVLPERTP